MNMNSPQMADAVSDTIRHPLLVWIASALGVVVIAYVDFFTGVEVRVFPLYYAPITLVAWYGSRSGALIVAALCAAAWLSSNLLAGLRFSHVGIWVVNTIVQGVSFATVGLLISVLRAAVIRERQLSRADPLTSLRNARAFYDEASRILALCRRKGRPVTVAYIDLDNFKAVNDRLGHRAGDDLLRTVADVLRASIRPSDLSARLGGDEFSILLPEVGQREAAATLERLRSLLADAVASSAGPVSASIGGVTFITVPEDVEEMVQKADSRMYSAKAAGKNRVHLDVAGHRTEERSVAASAKRTPGA